MPIFLAIIAGYFACFAGLVTTYFVRNLAEKWGVVDRPDGRRKKQKRPVALGGGAAILVSTVGSLLAIAMIYGDVTVSDFESPSGLIGLASAAFLLCAVGLIDDLVGIKGTVKLFWQVVAASLIVALGSGLPIPRTVILGSEIEFGMFGIPLAMFWILAAVNSFNLIDGIDGLASTVGLIFSVTLGIMALMTGHPLDAIISFSLAGALTGFLRYNLPPASIYLGDSGSMLIGVVLGTIAVRCALKEATTLAFMGPLAVWAVPFLDSIAALMRRKLTGRSMYTTDRGHIHHRLLTRGMSHGQALALLASLCLFTSIAALVSVYFSNGLIGLLAVVLVLVLLVGTRIFGHSEMLLLNDRIVDLGRTLLNRKRDKSTDAKQITLQLQGSLEWEDVWNGLVESAPRFHLSMIRLNLYLPHLHEDFYAMWQSPNPAPRDRQWNIEVPLMVDDDTVGRLSAGGVHDSENVGRPILDFVEFIEPLESQLREILASQQASCGEQQLSEEENPEVASHHIESLNESDDEEEETNPVQTT